MLEITKGPACFPRLPQRLPFFFYFPGYSYLQPIMFLPVNFSPFFKASQVLLPPLSVLILGFNQIPIAIPTSPNTYFSFNTWLSVLPAVLSVKPPILLFSPCHPSSLSHIPRSPPCVCCRCFSPFSPPPFPSDSSMS